jgi:hypothetical protein
MSARIRGALIVIVMSFATAGCSVTGASSFQVAGYWLVRVQGNYANVYPYPKSMPPWGSDNKSHALYLGRTESDAKAHLSTAARQIGVPEQHISFVSP